MSQFLSSKNGCEQFKAVRLVSNGICCSFFISGAPPSPPEADPLAGEPTSANVMVLDELTGELVMPEGEDDNFGDFSFSIGPISSRQHNS